ncbi:MAG TPA: DNA-binding protein [Acetobacteraceae bacterium]|nr:DNA-binding protein [Acetobacteraceae bacterium]
MTDYSFVLNFTLANQEDDPETYLDALYEAGCDDASVGVGRAGMIGLDFTRAAASAEDALRSAIENVRKAIPGAVLVQAGPDLVGITDMAEILGFSRQNMRKYAVGQSSAPEAFPPPAIIGDPSLWHLAEIASWLKLNTAILPPPAVFEVAKVTARINFEVESERQKRIVELA